MLTESFCLTSQKAIEVVKNNEQKNIGVIKSSNLCAEIVEYSDKNETSVCNLASIALPKFIKKSKNLHFQLI